MSSEEQNPEDGLEPPGPYQPPPSPSPAERPRGEPLEIEDTSAGPGVSRPERVARADDPAPDRRPPRSADDACPNCGAERTDANALVCLRCGFDMKTLQTLTTVTGESVEEDEEERERSLPPISRSGRGDLALPGVVAAVCGAVLLVAYLAGVRGLFPELEPGSSDVSIRFADRMIGLGRFAVLATVWAGCGLAGLVALAAVNGARFGDLRLAALRVLSMVVAMRLVTMIDLEPRAFEWLVEAPMQAAVFVSLATLLFSLSPRDALMHGLVTLAAFVGLWALGGAMVWVT